MTGEAVEKNNKTVERKLRNSKEINNNTNHNKKVQNPKVNNKNTNTSTARKMTVNSKEKAPVRTQTQKTNSARKVDTNKANNTSRRSTSTNKNNVLKNAKTSNSNNRSVEKRQTLRNQNQDRTKSETSKVNYNNNLNRNNTKKADYNNKKQKNSVEEKNEEKIKRQETIIEKIKNFLSKIAAMQEEAKKEIQESKENKKQKLLTDNNEKVVKVKAKPNYMLEYYDLPYRYNETVVKILAQTPKKLFVYWDISDNDKEKYIKSFGENFFNETYPVLLLFNEEKKYVKEIAINDFANSWYIDIDDPKTKYTIQLGRKFRNRPQSINVATLEREHVILQTDYLPIAMSNRIEAPNDHILFENFTGSVLFRNVKTNQERVVDVRKLGNEMAKAYNLKSFYDIYKNLYKDGIENGMFDLKNPTSGATSSVFK